MRKNTRSVIAAVAIALMIYAMTCLYSAQNMLAEAEGQLLRLGAELEQLEQENAVLAAKIERGNDDEIIEQLARERLGMVMPGEIIFYYTEG